MADSGRHRDAQRDDEPVSRHIVGVSTSPPHYALPMKALVISQQFQSPKRPNDCVALGDFPEPPAPGFGECRVRTLASALNHLDLWVARGVPGLNLDYPRVSGSDACGVVEAVGPGVDAAWLGKRVILNAAVATPPNRRPSEPGEFHMAEDYRVIGEHTNGTNAQFFNAPVNNLAVVSDTIDHKTAAAFGLAFLTAYSMMVTKAGLRPGSLVLVTGIGGGVALAALGIAKLWSCRVVVTSRHQSKLDRARTLGADECVLDAGQDWSKQVRAATGKRGVDIAVDSSGKATHLNCIKSLCRGGTYVTPGCTSGPDATTDLARIFWNQLRILGSTMGSNDEFAELAALFNSGKLAPVIDSVYPAARGVEAFERLEKSEQFGKLVIDWT